MVLASLAVPTRGAAQDLIVNGGFDGDIDGWKIVRRTLRPLDGTEDARALLRKVIAP